MQAGPRGARQTQTFPDLDAAVAWKRDIDDAKRSGALARTRAPKLRDAAGVWEQDARAGVALARGRKRYRTQTIDEYVRILDAALLEWTDPHGPDCQLGDHRLDQIDDALLTDVVADLQRQGLAASTVRNRLMPLRAIFRYAVKRRWGVAVNPTVGLEVPTGSGRRMRIVPAGEILAFIRILPAEDRALWAIAFYAGLRRGELMGLRWDDVDLASGVIHVRQAFTPSTGTVGAPKSEAGVRKVPISGELREFLTAFRARAGARARGFVFARGALAGSCKAGRETSPFLATTVTRRAAEAWLEAQLPPVTLHDCRHTFASLTIAAMAARGVFNPKLIQQVMGHSSIQVTYDRYGHLFPGQEAELGEMLDDYLGGAAVRPEVSKALAALRDALERADDGARPMVAEAVRLLEGCDSPAGEIVAATSVDRPASVQRGRGAREVL